MTAILAENLVKRFGDLTAVNSINLEINEGEIFGFLGPNGAGKTTTIRMLTGVVPPDSGSVLIKGVDISREPVKAKMKIGVIPENSSVYPDLTAEQNLLLTGKFYKLSGRECRWQTDDLLERFELSDRRYDKVSTFSKGMKQRISIACAVVHTPDVLFLDEPTEGLDVRSKRLIHEIINEVSEEGGTVFLTTHNIEEASSLCGSVGIINKGKMVAFDTPDNLKSTFETTQSVQVSFDAYAQKSWFESENVSKIEVQNSRLRLYTDSPDQVIRQVTKISELHNMKIISLETSGPSLEEAFLRFTGDDI